MIRIVTCGHIKEKWLKDGIQEYFKRITAYDKIEIIEVDDEKTPDEAPDAIVYKIKQTGLFAVNFQRLTQKQQQQQ